MVMNQTEKVNVNLKDIFELERNEFDRKIRYMPDLSFDEEKAFFELYGVWDEVPGIIAGRAKEHPDNALVVKYVNTLLDYFEKTETSNRVKTLIADVQGVIEDNYPTPPIQPMSDFANYNPPAWIVEGWLPRREVTILSGPGGVGKSRLALQIAASVAMGGGIDLFCNGTFKTARQGAVLYATWEDRADTVKARLNQLPFKPSLLETDMHVYELRGQGPIWSPQRGSRHLSTIATPTTLYYDLSDMAQLVDAKLVVFDTVASCYMSDENARPLVRAFLNTLTGLADKLDAAILLLAHPPKQTGVQFSGSTDWTNAGRMALTFDYDKHSGQPVFKVVKSNLAAKPDPIYFERDSYPYLATDKEVVEMEESGPRQNRLDGAKTCKGYAGFECTEIVHGRTQRCPECKKRQKDIVRARSKAG